MSIILLDFSRRVLSGILYTPYWRDDHWRQEMTIPRINEAGEGILDQVGRGNDPRTPCLNVAEGIARDEAIMKRFIELAQRLDLIRNASTLEEVQRIVGEIFAEFPELSMIGPHPFWHNR